MKAFFELASPRTATNLDRFARIVRPLETAGIEVTKMLASASDP